MNTIANTSSSVSIGVSALALTLALGCSSDKQEPANTSTQPAQASGDQRTLLAVGTPAPDFTAEAHDGTTVTLSGLRGQPTVLYFYPKDETPG